MALTKAEIIEAVQSELNLTKNQSTDIVGSIGIHIKEDVHRYTAEMGYWLGEPFWNKGIMTEIVKRFTQYAFDNFKLHRIFAEPYATNKASMRVLEKVGFKSEGVLRANVYKNGKIVDQVVYAKLKENQ